MKKTLSCAAFAAIIVFFSLAACSMGLDPASNDSSGKTALSLKIGALIPPAESFAKGAPRVSGGRIVAPDYGYLYIRTIGGPTGSSGPFYGPFRLDTGDTFRTTAIPAGVYTGIGVLYATKPLDDLSIELEGSTVTFPQLMRLPDAEFLAMTDSGEEEGEGEDNPIDLMIGGLASAELVENVTISAGKENTLTVTLRPVTGENGVEFWNGEEYFDKASDPGVLAREFIRLEGITPDSGYQIDSVSVMIYPEGAATYIGRCMLFSDEGSLIREFGAVGDVSTMTTLTAPWVIGDTEDGTDLYLYIEYRTSMLSLVFGASQSPADNPTLNVSFAGTSSYAGMRLFYAVYPVSVLPDLTGDPTGSPVAAGMIVLDASGSGSALAMRLDGSGIMEFGNGVYYACAFVDRDGTYSDINNALDIPGGIMSVTPNRNDGITIDQYAAQVFAGDPLSYSLTPSDLTLKEEYVYFVNQGGTGAGDRPDRARALSGLLEDLATTGTNEYEIYLTDDVALSEAMNVQCASVVLMSSGTGSRVLTNSYTETSPLYVNQGSILYLRNITIDSNESRYNPMIDVYGELYIMDGASIIDASNDEGPGAIEFNPGSLGAMFGGSITNCSGQYGAIRVTSSSTLISSFVMTGGLISGCQNSTNGTIYLEGDMGVGAYANFAMSGGTISGCSSTSFGGGVNISSYGFMTLSGDATITGCSAEYYGGGIYLASQGQLILEGGSVTLCSAVYGGGGLYYSGMGLTDEGGILYNVFHDNVDDDDVFSGT